MAVLYNDGQLPLDLWGAAEKQRNGEPYEIKVSAPVTIEQSLYDEIFASLSRNNDLKAVLSRITSDKLKYHWRELFGEDLINEDHPKIRIPRGVIKAVPCVNSVDNGFIVVSMSFFIEGAKDIQTEQVLKRCIKKENVACKGSELFVTLNDVKFRLTR